jgi:hypothetical protein
VAYPEVPLWLDLARLARDFALSGAAALRLRPAFRGLERHCLFIGAPRNGHSLVGALLDAHPQMIVAHELGVPRYVAARFSRRQVLCLLAANARRAAARGRRHIHYSHAVPGQWQGRYRDLRVIGDKHGEGFLLSVQARPWLTAAVLERFAPAYFIHVVRNPYDALASVATSSKRGQSLERAIAYFEGLYRTLEQVRGQVAPERLCLLRFEVAGRDLRIPGRRRAGQLPGCLCHHRADPARRSSQSRRMGRSRASPGRETDCPA